LTNQNYAELQELYSRHQAAGLEILAFPCNRFGAQEPGTNEQILEFARGKGATFPIMGKLDCGSDPTSHPLFLFLTTKMGSGILGGSIKWNFTKFLCDKDGIPVKRYGPPESPLSFEKDIVAMLSETSEETSSPAKAAPAAEASCSS
jgi:glutathione peroxidase